MYSIPENVIDFIKTNISNCNNHLSRSLSIFPGIREEALDNNLIGYFSNFAGPIKIDPNWILRFEAHFIGGGRHYKTWEVADIGLMVIFREKGKIVKSKMAFLQSKKLYANRVKFPAVDPFDRMGMGKLLDTDEEHSDIVSTKTMLFNESSKYMALKKGSRQQESMSYFEKEFNMKMYYLLYNPMSIPHSIISPYEGSFHGIDNKIGCRVINKASLDAAMKSLPNNHSPSFNDLKRKLKGDYKQSKNVGGWRLEYFVVDLLIGCSEGLIDDSPNFKTLTKILNAKVAPISAAFSITIDFDSTTLPTSKNTKEISI